MHRNLSQRHMIHTDRSPTVAKVLAEFVMSGDPSGLHQPEKLNLKGNESRLEAWLSGMIDLPTEHTENFKDRRSEVLKLCKKACKKKEKEILRKQHPPKLKVPEPETEAGTSSGRKRKTSRHSQPSSPRTPDPMEIHSLEEPPRKQSRTEPDTEEKLHSSKKKRSSTKKLLKGSCDDDKPRRSPSKETLGGPPPKEERRRSGSRAEKKRNLTTSKPSIQPLVSEYEVGFIEKAYLGTLDLKTSNYGIPGAGYGMGGYGMPLGAPNGSYAMGGYGSNVLSQLRGNHSGEGGTSSSRNDPSFDDSSSDSDDATTYYWDTNFQRIRQELQKSPDNASESKVSLFKLYDDFVQTAKMYGRVIIQEKSFPDRRKSIKPCSLGGIAGGQKFIKEGILFKFAIPSKLFQEDIEAAMKVAGHDLKSLIQFSNLSVPDLCFPLMTLVDYLGYRLVAMSLLPIDNETLEFGSANAGRAIHDSNPALSKALAVAGKKLNLKSHKVSSGSEVRMHTPVDMEGHATKNGHFYVLDFSRLFPPESHPTTECPYNYLFKLLRPEFVLSYALPLSPDAYSNFQDKDESHINNRELSQAIFHLRAVTIPKFTAFLNQSDLAPSNPKLIEEMHRCGVNCRHLGLVLAAMIKTEWRQVIFIEMLSRVMKTKMRRYMREAMEFKIVGSGVLPFIRTAYIYMNIVLGNSDFSANHWNETLLPELQTKFEGNWLQVVSSDLALGRTNCQNLFPRIVTRLAFLTGIVFTKFCLDEIAKGDIFMFPHPFDFTDISNIEERVRYHPPKITPDLRDLGCMQYLLQPPTTNRGVDAVARVTACAAQHLRHIIDPVKTLTLGASAQADFLKDTATVFEEGPRKKRYLEMALQKYNEILPLDPKCSHVLFNIADIHIQLADLIPESSISQDHQMKAKNYFKFVIIPIHKEKLARDPNDEFVSRVCCFHKYAQILDKLPDSMNFEIEDNYLSCLERNPANVEALYEYGLFVIVKCGRVPDAMAIWDLCLPILKFHTKYNSVKVRHHEPKKPRNPQPTGRGDLSYWLERGMSGSPGMMGPTRGGPVMGPRGSPAPGSLAGPRGSPAPMRGTPAPRARGSGQGLGRGGW